jgi:hypothetical protein
VGIEGSDVGEGCAEMALSEDSETLLSDSYQDGQYEMDSAYLAQS